MSNEASQRDLSLYTSSGMIQVDIPRWGLLKSIYPFWDNSIQYTFFGIIQVVSAWGTEETVPLRLRNEKSLAVSKYRETWHVVWFHRKLCLKRFDFDQIDAKK